jgi:aldehyde dehydrogenase (NAD+)
MALARRALADSAMRPTGCCSWSQGGATSARALVDDPRVPLCPRPDRPRWAAPWAAGRGSVRAGVARAGGNNAMIVCPSADLELASAAILFSAAGRRASVHEPAAADRPRRGLPTRWSPR